MKYYMKQMPKTSVCMATYNGQRYLKRQLESILVQLGDNDEIIISDDNSTDNTRQVISSFNDSRIRFLINTERTGPVGNFQNAINQSKGDFIFLADQDDVWLPNKVAVTIKLLLDYDLVLSNCVVVDDTLNTIYPSFFDVRRSRKGFLHNLIKNSYMGCCMAFRREIILYALPFPMKIHMHDWWIGLVTEIKGKTHFCNEPLILYVRHGGNASPTSERSYSLTKQIRNRIGMIKGIISRINNLL